MAETGGLQKQPPVDGGPWTPTLDDFLRGKALGQPLGPDNVYAIRCNEQYVDGEAAIEGERTHARAAMLKAGSIHLFFPHGKRPIIILSKFEQSNIKSATERATDAAKKRIRCMKRSASTKLEVKKRDIPGQLRIIGKNADLEEIARKVPAESFWAVRSHHIDGLSTAHVYLTDEVAKQVLDSFNVTIERVSNIVSSLNSSKQLTIRKDNTTFDNRPTSSASSNADKPSRAPRPLQPPTARTARSASPLM